MCYQEKFGLLLWERHLYMSIPGTASRITCLHLFDNGAVNLVSTERHYRFEQINKNYKYRDDIDKFMVTARNPYTHCVGRMYNTLQMSRSNDLDLYGFYSNKMDGKLTEEKSVSHLIPASHWVKGIPDEKVKVLCFETILQDLKSLTGTGVKKYEGVSVSAKPENIFYKDYRSFYKTEKYVDLIRDVFKDDFDYWGYDPDITPLN